MKKYADEIRNLNQLQYSVTQEKGTERPFENIYNDECRDGIYVDIVSKVVLFSSKDKFNSGSGWPSFTNPIDENSIEKKRDFSHGVIRTEVKCIESNTHLGHVFDDGPDNNLRYCINSASILFIPKDKMKENGYDDYICLFNN